MNISEKDLVGIYFFRCDNLEKIYGYYDCINRLTELFQDVDFANSVTGFYFNVSDGFNSVRLSFFRLILSKQTK